MNFFGGISVLVCKTPNCLGKVFHVNVNVHHVNYIILPAKVAAKDLSIKTSVQRTNLPHYYILVFVKRLGLGLGTGNRESRIETVPVLTV